MHDLERRTALLGGAAFIGSGLARPAFTQAGGITRVDDFGAKGDDRADDRAAIQAAIDTWCRRGGTLSFGAGKRYFLGAYSGIQTIFTIQGIRGGRIEGNGAVLRTTSQAMGTKIFLFQLKDYVDLHISGLRAHDDGTDIKVDWRGLYAFVPDGTMMPCANLSIEDVVVSDAVAFLYSGGLRAGRISGIRIRNCRAERCYYGMVFEENGDDVDAELETVDCRRSYFPYGVSRHRVRLLVRHDGSGPGANACCLIKRYARDTHEIDLRARFAGPRLPFAYAAKLEQQPRPGTGQGSITGIRIDLDLGSWKKGDVTIPLGISSFDSAGEERGKTPNFWDDITLSGRFPPDMTTIIDARVQPLLPGHIRLIGLPPMTVAGFMIEGGSQAG